MLIMNNKRDFLIPFSGLKNGEHRFEFQVDDIFFKDYDYEDFNHINADISVLLNKKTSLLELNLTSKGIINTACDVTNQDFDLPIEGHLNLIVKFGEEFNDDHDEVLVIPFTEHQIDVSQYIYEMIVLSIPQKRVHPGVLDGTLDSEALDFLGYNNNSDEKPETEDDDTNNNDEEIDPRWAELKKLLTDK